MEMNKVLKFELLNNCISCDLYLLFTRCYATRDTVKLLKYLNDKSNFYLVSQMCPYLICFVSDDSGAQPDSPRDMYWSEQRNLMNCGILMTSMNPVWLTSKCPQALAK